MKKYIRFGIMILTSTIAMYVLMYLNTFELYHVTFSETRVYMAIMMGAVMVVIMMLFIMMLFMWKMYQNKKLDYLILGISMLTFGISLWLVRSQSTIKDVS